MFKMIDFITTHFLPGLVKMSLEASVVILIVMLVRRLLKRAPKIFSYALWSIVLFRLLCPISIATPISVFNVGSFVEEKLAEVEIPEEIVIADMTIPLKLQMPEWAEMSLVKLTGKAETQNAVVQNAGAQNTDAQNVIAQNAGDQNAGVQAGDTFGAGLKAAGVGAAFRGNASFATNTASVATIDQTVRLTADRAATGSEKTGRFDKLGSTFATVFAVVWLMGMLVLFGTNGVHLIRMGGKLASSENLRCNIYLCDEIETPFCLGLIRPRIYLPANLGKLEQKYVLLHEQTHIQRLDHIIKILAFLALGLHWFNPLVWAAYILAGKDMEMSCDDVVMRKINGDIRVPYSTSILRLSSGRQFETAFPLAFGDGDAKQRIQNVMNYKKPRFAVLVLAALICLLTTGCLITDSKAASTVDSNMATVTIEEMLGSIKG